MIEEQRKILASLWMKKADESLAEAEDEFEHERLSVSISRLYYTIFYAVSAAQAAKRNEYGKHSTVRAVLNRDYVKTGKVSAEFGNLYNDLFDDRNDADYKPVIKFEREDVGERILQVKMFLDFFKGMLSEDGE